MHKRLRILSGTSHLCRSAFRLKMKKGSHTQMGDYVRGFEDAVELVYSLTVEKRKYADFKKELNEILRKMKERKYAFLYEKIVLM